VPEQRQPAADRRQVAGRLRVDERDPRLRIGEPVLEGVRAEQERQRHRHRAHLVDGDVRDDGLAPLRQDQRDPVAAAHAEAGQHVGQPVGLALQVPEGVRGRGARLVFPVQREPRAIRGPAAAARVRDVEIGRHVPAPAGVDLSVAVGRHGLTTPIKCRPPGRCAAPFGR